MNDNWKDVTMRDPQKAFENAIAWGMNPDEYMYMYTEKNFDYFKHIETREYRRYPLPGEPDKK